MKNLEHIDLVHGNSKTDVDHHKKQLTICSKLMAMIVMARRYMWGDEFGTSPVIDFQIIDSVITEHVYGLEDSKWTSGSNSRVVVWPKGGSKFPFSIICSSC